MYLNDYPAAPAWDAVQSLTAGEMRSESATALVQAAVREAATQRATAQAGGDTAAVAVLSDRLARLAIAQSMINGTAAAADFVDIAESVPSVLPDFAGALKTLVVAAVVIGGLWVVVPQLGTAVGRARGAKSF